MSAVDQIIELGEDALALRDADALDDLTPPWSVEPSDYGMPITWSNAARPLTSEDAHATLSTWGSPTDAERLATRQDALHDIEIAAKAFLLARDAPEDTRTMLRERLEQTMMIAVLVGIDPHVAYVTESRALGLSDEAANELAASMTANDQLVIAQEVGEAADPASIAMGMMAARSASVIATAVVGRDAPLRAIVYVMLAPSRARRTRARGRASRGHRRAARSLAVASAGDGDAPPPRSPAPAVPCLLDERRIRQRAHGVRVDGALELTGGAAM